MTNYVYCDLCNDTGQVWKGAQGGDWHPCECRKGKPMVSKLLTFENLRFANVQRNKEWDPDNKLTASFRGLEASGEIGELLEKAAILIEMSIAAGKLNNFIKKLERERMGITGSRVTWHELAQEWADCIITLDLIGMHFSIDAEVIRFKFNVTSEKMGLATRL